MLNLSTVLYTSMMVAVGFMGLLISLLVHEAGHAIALIRRGLKVEELGLGIPLNEFGHHEPSPDKLEEMAWRRANLPNYYRAKSWVANLVRPLTRPIVWTWRHRPRVPSGVRGKLPSFPRGAIVRVKHRRLPFELTLAPLLIGAYVKHDMDELRRLPYKDQAVVFGAGVVMNFLFAEAIGLGYFIVKFVMNPDIATGLFVGTMLILLLVTYFGRRIISMTAPLIGAAFLGLAIWSFTHPLSGQLEASAGSASQTGGGGGPIFVVEYAMSGRTWGEVLMVIAMISMSLGFTNMIPMVPLDGGQTMVAFLRRFRMSKFIPMYAGGTRLAFIGLFGFLMVVDVRHLFMG